MKNLSEEQYERIARWLDGEAADLTAEERQAAEDIRREEYRLGPALDVPRAGQAVQRLSGRILAGVRASRQELLPGRPVPDRRVLRHAYYAASAAAAAGLVLAILFLWPRPAQTPAPQPPAQAGELLALEQMFPGPSARDQELAMLSSQLALLEAEIALSPGPSVMEASLDDLERQVEDFWIDDPSAG